MFILNVEETSAIDMDTCCISTEPVEILFNDELPTYNYTVIYFTHKLLNHL